MPTLIQSGAAIGRRLSRAGLSGLTATLVLLVPGQTAADYRESELHRPGVISQVRSSLTFDPAASNAWRDLSQQELTPEILEGFRRHLARRTTGRIALTDEQRLAIDFGELSKPACNEFDHRSMELSLEQTITRPTGPGGSQFGVISHLTTLASEAFELGWHDQSIRNMLTIHQVLRGTVWTYSQAGLQFVVGRFHLLLDQRSAAESAFARGMVEWGPGLSYGGNSRNFHQTQLFVGRALQATLRGNTRNVLDNLERARESNRKSLGQGFSPTYFHRAIMAEIEADARMRNGDAEGALAAMFDELSPSDRYAPDVMTALIVERIAFILLQTGDFETAEALSRRAIAMLQAKCPLPASRRIAQARQTLARALAGQYRWAEAMEVFDANAEALGVSDPEAWEARFASDPAIALARLSTGQDMAVNTTRGGDDIDTAIVSLLADGASRADEASTAKFTDIVTRARRLDADAPQLSAGQASRLILLLNTFGESRH